MRGLLIASVSLVIPGAGQFMRGRLAEGALWLWIAAWLHALAMGAVRSRIADVDTLAAFVAGAAAHAQAPRVPEAVVLTALAVAVHACAALDARRRTVAVPGQHDPVKSER